MIVSELEAEGGIRYTIVNKIKGVIGYFMEKRPLPLWLVVLLVLVIIGVTSLAYVTYSPGANRLCKACHNMEPFVEGIKTTGHDFLNCHKCHPLGLDVVKELYIQITESPSAAEIKEEVSKELKLYKPCLECHKESQLEELPIHQVHLTMAIDVLGSCDICHNLHAASELPLACTQCHQLGHAIEEHSKFHEYAETQLERGNEGVCFECHSPTAKWEVPLSESCLTGIAQGQTCFDCHQAPLNPPNIANEPCTECHR